MVRILTLPLLFVAIGFALAGCKDQASENANNTAVLGSAGPPQASLDFPKPPVPRTAKPEIARIGPDEAIAVWEHDGNVIASRYLPISGWQPPETLENIGGQSSNPQVAGNMHGIAMAIWQHSVGRIESLRFSRYQDGKGWTTPDVMPGALPKPRQPGKTVGAKIEDSAPRIEIDPSGNVRAQWPSGFDEGQWQVSTFVAHEGWSRPVDVPVASR